MRLRRLAVGIATLVALVAGNATPAWAADDFLVVADPGPRQELTDPPGWVTLVFKTEAGASYAAIVVHNSAGENVTTGALIVEGTNVTTQLLTGLPKDTYTVIYRTEDANGEPRGGAYQFSYGPGTWTDVDDQWIGEEEQPPEIDNPGPQASIEPSAEATDTAPPATPTPSATATDQPGATAEPTPAPTQPGEGPNLLPWLIGGAVLVVAVVIGLVAARRRSGGGPGTPPAVDSEGSAPDGDDQATPPEAGGQSSPPETGPRA